MGFFFDDEELGLSVGVTDAVELEVGDSEVVDAVVESGLLENCTSFTIPDSDVVDPVFFFYFINLILLCTNIKYLSLDST